MVLRACACIALAAVVACSPSASSERPDRPASVTAVAGVRSADVSWQRPADTRGDLLRYVVSASPSIGEPVAVEPNVTSLRLENLTNGGEYVFRVAAVNIAGESEPASSAPVRLPDVPSAPPALLAELGDAGLRASWQPAADNGLPVQQYRVRSASPPLDTLLAATELTYVTPGLLPGATYVLSVSAINAVGEGPAASSAPVAVPALPGAPANVMATQGTSTESVTVSWSAVPGATAYRLFRDGALVDTTSATQFVDTGAGAGTPGAAPRPVATKGAHLDRVAVTWSAASPLDGASHGYRVAALNVAGAGPASGSADGYRGALAITGYELSADDGMTWQPVGQVFAWDDASAPAATIVPGTATASKAMSLFAVTATLTGHSAFPGAARTYRVRATTASAPGAASPSDTGYRGVGALTLQWERTDSDSATAPYMPLAGATTAAFTDVTPPANGEGRWYRCVVSAPGAANATTAAARGFIYVAPPTNTSRQTWVTNGTVRALAQQGTTTYLGGDFTYVGPNTGGFAALDKTAGAGQSGRAKPDNAVRAVAPDGASGWYIGGQFHWVDGVARDYIAHVLANGQLDPTFDAAADGIVYSLAYANGVVYAGGYFSIIGGALRRSLAALDATTGAALPWNAVAGSQFSNVTSLVVSGPTLYVGGGFGTLGGQNRLHLAAVDLATGMTLPWNPVVATTATINALAVSGSTVYIGGQFTAVNGTPRVNLAAVDAVSGGLTPFNPAPDDAVNALAATSTTLYVVGDFANAAGQLRLGGAAFDLGNGSLSAWNPTSNHRVSRLGVDGSTVYLGGWFSTMGGQTRSYLAAVDATTGALTAWNPKSTTERIYAIASDGTHIFVGGEFRTLGGVLRNRLAALDASGAATSWNPNASHGVAELVVVNNVVYAGGDFTTMGGQTRNRLAAIDANGNVLVWNPNANGSVAAMAASGTRIYVGGYFTTIGGQTRQYLAAVDTSGTLSSWVANANASVLALTTSNGLLYVGGNFTTLDGVARNRVAAVDANGVATAWNPNAGGAVTAIGIGEGTIYLGGSFGLLGGVTRTRVGAVTTAGVVTSWNPYILGAGGVDSIAVYGRAVYLAGYFDTINSEPRDKLAAVDIDGALMPWTVPASRPPRVLMVDGNGVLTVGGEFETLGNTPQSCIGVFTP